MSASPASRLNLLAGHLAPTADANASHGVLRSAPASAVNKTVRDQIRAIGNGTVTLDINYRPGIALIRLSQPAKRNAMSGKMTAELADAVDRLESICVRGGWKGNRRGPNGHLKAPAVDAASSSADREAEDNLVAVVLAGDQGTFCAGFDLTGVPADAGEGRTRIVDLMIETLHRLRNLPLITCAAMDGYTLGGGTEITMHADHRFMAQTSKMRMVQIKMGLASAWEGGSKLFRLLPRGRSAFLQLYGQSPVINAQLALAYHLIDGVAPPGKTALDHATEFLSKYVTGEDGTPHSIMAIRGLKELVDAFEDRFIEEDEQVEAEVRTRLSASDASRKALGAAMSSKKVTKRL